MRISIYIPICIFLLTGLYATAYSAPICDGTILKPCVVQDTTEKKPLENWRTSKQMAEKYKGNTFGLENMHISLSAAPSDEGFKALAAKIKKIMKNKINRMIDLDLRQESHGYVNGQEINLTEYYNWINLNKTRNEVIFSEKMWLSKLQQTATISNVLTPKDFKAGNYSNGKPISITTMSNEKELAEKYAFEYIRLTVTDHRAPRNEEVDEFVTLVASLTQSDWLHIHCRGGQGRTATFFVMVDMLKNADRVSFYDILARQAAVEPNYDLFTVVHSKPELTPYYQARLEFLMHFYQFASARLHGFTGNWTDWVEVNHLVIASK